MANFTHSCAALRHYDTVERPRLDRLCADIKTHEDQRAYAAVHEAARVAVAEAFYLDTQHINSRDYVMLMNIDDVRRILDEALTRWLNGTGPRPQW